jgi:hypothetical protein
MLNLYRDLIALRRELDGPLQPLDDVADGVLAFRRGAHLVALNLADSPRPAPPARALVRHTHDPDRSELPAALSPGEGFLAQA